MSQCRTGAASSLRTPSIRSSGCNSGQGMAVKSSVPTRTDRLPRTRKCRAADDAGEVSLASSATRVPLRAAIDETFAEEPLSGWHRLPAGAKSLSTGWKPVSPIKSQNRPPRVPVIRIPGATDCRLRRIPAIPIKGRFFSIPYSRSPTPRFPPIPRPAFARGTLIPKSLRSVRPFCSP